MSCLRTSTLCSSAHQELDSNDNVDLQLTSHLSPAGFREEEGELSDQETGVSTQEPDQDISDEQNYTV